MRTLDVLILGREGESDPHRTPLEYRMSEYLRASLGEEIFNLTGL